MASDDSIEKLSRLCYYQNIERAMLLVLKDKREVPTILRVGPYRIYFWSHEPDEPPHVHIDRDNESAKFWLEPVGLAQNLGFNARELRKVEQIVLENQMFLLEKWYDYFNKSR